MQIPRTVDILRGLQILAIKHVEARVTFRSQGTTYFKVRLTAVSPCIQPPQSLYKWSKGHPKVRSSQDDIQEAHEAVEKVTKIYEDPFA